MTSRALAAVALLAAGFGAACAHKAIVTEPLADGSYRVRCRASLPDCLDEGVETLCRGRHYVVLRAVDERDAPATREASYETRSSEIVVRCGPASGWGAMGRPMEVAPPAPAPAGKVTTCAAAPSAAPPSGRACVPGTTQSCVGIAGCTGGQSCVPDGSGFSACDCGGLKTVPATPYP